MSRSLHSVKLMKNLPMTTVDFGLGPCMCMMSFISKNNLSVLFRSGISADISGEGGLLNWDPR